MAIKIMLVDDHDVFREGLKELLHKQADLEVVEEAATAFDALERSEGKEIDVMVLDISMPGPAAAVAAEEILKRPNPPAIVV